jgi:hypothetical protein
MPNDNPRLGRVNLRIADLVPGEPTAIVGTVDHLRRDLAANGEFWSLPTVCHVDDMYVVSEGNNRLCAAQLEGRQFFDVILDLPRDDVHEASLQKLGTYCVGRGWRGFEGFPRGSEQDRLNYYLRGR